MSSSGSEFAADESQDSSTDHDLRPSSRIHSTPASPRKRRRSESSEWVRKRKKHLEGKYSDPYRNLFNDDVNAAASRFVIDDSLKPEQAQFGAVQWTSKEKHVFFAALERLGKDDLPGISKAIGTKTIQETRQLLLAIQEAPSQRTALRGDSRLKVALQDVPAAFEIGRDCEESLELAGDALAWYQERFEAKQEQARFGERWLITYDWAEEIEKALQPTYSRDLVSSPGFPDTDEKIDSVGHHSEPHPILKDIPEAELLKPIEFLDLSRQFFMNASSNVSYPWPHWTELISEIAQEPSIYRTAFSDIHNLAVSLTRRIVQTAIVQATSRIRSQGWRVKKGLKPFVRTRDVLTAVDLMGLARNGHRRWAGVARRCGLQVTSRDKEAHGTAQRRTVPWHEAEEYLGLEDPNFNPSDTDAETVGLASGTDDENFRRKAMRSGTPLPTMLRSSSADSDAEMDINCEEDVDSDTHSRSDDGDSDPPGDATPPESEILRQKYEDELDAVDAFDRIASRQEENQLWGMLHAGRAGKEDSVDTKIETDETKFQPAHNKLTLETGDWRAWTQYRAEWESLAQPIPASKFIVTRKGVQDSLAQANDEYNGRFASGRGKTSNTNKSYQDKRKITTQVDIPTRGAREYAEIQERANLPRDRSPGWIASFDGPDDPAPSIEIADGRHSSDDDEMILDNNEY